ncbi:hypothetical protein [Solirhodobacter olei]|uniref:hypothetical protein n=1 Tax=Solirhodobacter olei TaxID=2493082 RepID=UPI000FDB706A|nr:hypothetical protein [Solirhodobacter olei]
MAKDRRARRTRRVTIGGSGGSSLVSHGAPPSNWDGLEHFVYAAEANFVAAKASAQAGANVDCNSYLQRSLDALDAAAQFVNDRAREEADASRGEMRPDVPCHTASLDINVAAAWIAGLGVWLGMVTAEEARQRRHRALARQNVIDGINAKADDALMAELRGDDAAGRAASI